MADVYAWPPVGCVGSEWTVDAPVNRSVSLRTGRRYVSAHARERRLVSLEVSALSKTRSGAGYMEALKRLLQGGVGLVRLDSRPINWHLDHQAEAALRQSSPFTWSDGETQIDWLAGNADLAWFDGAVLEGTATTDGIWPALSVTGLPPSRLIARPSEFVTLFSAGAPQTVQIVTEARSDASGAAILRLFDPVSGSGRVNIGTSESRVFEAISMPRAVQPVGTNWSYSWSFREVFADEVGGFEEIDPWT